MATARQIEANSRNASGPHYMTEAGNNVYAAAGCFAQSPVGRSAEHLRGTMKLGLPRCSGVPNCRVHAREENPPPDTEAVEWFPLTMIELGSPEAQRPFAAPNQRRTLLTTLPRPGPFCASSSSDAEQCLRWYCLRWRIEDWHRVLKSGCRIEDIAHETAERVRRAIAINLVIAWRIMLMTLLGRETPGLPPEVLFSDVELQTLRAYAKNKGLKPPVLLGEAVRMVAKIGGYLGRKNDPPPGHQLIWQGYAALQLMSFGFALKKE